MAGLCRSRIVLRVACLLPTLVTTTGCRSHHIETTVENRTGAMVELLEVDYPSASFGANALAAGADYNYRIQIRGTGALKVQYTAAGGLKEQVNGPALTEGQQGRLLIVLLPGGKAEFRPELTAAP